MTNRFLSIILGFFLFFSCSRPQYMEETLEYAGNNRSELEKVLQHYADEPLKLKAAEFLISGMLYNKFSYEGEIIGQYAPLFAAYDSLYMAGNHAAGDPLRIRLLWDSLVKQHGPINLSNLAKKQDRETLSSDFLIQNIDDAFYAWEKSFMYNEKDFDLFCEYILPYRVQNEPVMGNRSGYQNEFVQMTDTVKTPKGLIHAFHQELFVNRSFRMSQLLWDYPLEFPASVIESGHRASCRQMAPWQAMLMRSCGFPVTVDRAVWANRSQGHLWNVLLMGDGRFYPFDVLEDTIKFAYKPAKIYRKTFSFDTEPFKNVSAEDVPASFFRFDEKDVTAEYVKTCNVEVSVQFSFPEYKNKKHGVICTFDNRNWRPVAFGKIHSGKMRFENIATDILCIAAYYDRGQIIPATEPFLIDSEGNIRFFNADQNNRISMLLTRKYPMFSRVEDFAWGIRRANAEGADNQAFDNPVRFFTIYEVPYNVTDSIVSDSRKYRYIRFKANLERYANLAEVEFYGRRRSGLPEERLSGRLLGYPPVSEEDEHPYTHAVDGNLETWFGKQKNAEGWVGYDLGKGNESIVTRVRFCPRSDTNFILGGDTYELMYWNEKQQWQSAEKKQAKQYNFIEFDSVPSGALYLLHDVTRGVEDRPFLYLDGKQVFY